MGSRVDQTLRAGIEREDELQGLRVPAARRYCCSEVVPRTRALGYRVGPPHHTDPRLDCSTWNNPQCENMLERLDHHLCTVKDGVHPQVQ